MSPDTTNINMNSRVKPTSIFTIQEWLLFLSDWLNLSRAHKLVHWHWYDSTTEAFGSIFLIKCPPKIWRPNIQNKYTPPDYANNIDDGVFGFEFYGKTIFSQNRFGKRDSRTTLSLFVITHIKKSSRGTCASDRNLTHKHVLESQISS